MTRTKLSEEGLGLMRRIVEANAWRQALGVNILGHCLKTMGDLEGKRDVHREIGVCLDFYEELSGAYTALGGGDLDSAVRDWLMNVPMPESRFEFGVCRLLTDRAQRIALACYSDSSCRPFAVLAQHHIERPALVGIAERQRMADFCSEPVNLPRAQEAFERWLLISLLALGRPGTTGDQRALELGLRAQSSEQLNATFLAEMHALASSWGLALPSGDRLPIDLGPELPTRIAAAV